MAITAVGVVVGVGVLVGGTGVGALVGGIAVGVAVGGTGIGVRGWVAWLAAVATFREGRAWLDELTGLELGAETIRAHGEAAGAALAAARAEAAAAVAKARESAEPVDAAPGQLVVEADGVMVRHLDGWHEVKVGTVGGWDGERTAAQSHLASRAPAEAFGPLLLAEAARRGALDGVGRVGAVTRRGLYRLRPVVALGDGAAWIWNLAEDHFGARTGVVDFYHAAEHLWEAADAAFGAGTGAAAAWAKARIHELREEGAKPVRRALAALLPRGGAGADPDEEPGAAAEAPEAAPEPGSGPSPALGEAAREAVRRELGYFRANAARMDYPAFRARGLPIGAGAVESAAKHVVQLRMKRPGARWSEGGAERILAVRERSLSGRPLLLNAADPPPIPRPTERAA
jgi:hypothetical protein